MGMIKLRVLDNRFEADVLSGALDLAGLPYVLRTYEDTAYDGLFVSQNGYGVIYVAQNDSGQAQVILNDVIKFNWLASLAQSIDHTLLRPGATLTDLEKHLAQCLENSFAAACVNPWMVPRTAELLEGSDVAVCTVVDFPFGLADPGGKRAQAVEAVKCGATEIDVVINRGLVFSGKTDQAVAEIASIVQAVSPVEVKVILETGELGPELTATVSKALAHSGAAWLKTGSGHYGPATVEDVRIMRASAPELGVKAAGGIRYLDQALALLDAGAGRLGTSSGKQLMKEAHNKWNQNG